MAAYAITRELDASFDDTVARITASLAEQGFGVLTTIDVRNTLKLASRGLKIEPDLGVLLPCNVVVRTVGQSTHIAAMEPFAAMKLADNPELEPLATEARERIEKAVNEA